MIAPLPPPVHGSSMVSLSMKESSRLNGLFRMDWVNLSTSRSMEEIDKRSPGLTARKAVRFASSYTRALWLLMTRRYDLCYVAVTCHGVGFLKDAPFVLICKLFRRKVVLHQHNKGMAGDVDRWPYRWLLPLIYNKVKVVLLSQYLYPDIMRVVRREDVMICPNGIKPVLDRAVEHLTTSVPHLLFLSNLLVDKGVLTLLDALKILKDKGRRFVCDFVGSETRDMDAVSFAKEVGERGLEGIAVYHGRKYGREKDEYFRRADIFVFPTFYSNECMPLVILEAMEYGLPVVTTGEGGIRDEVEDGRNGLVVESRSPEALAAAVDRLISDGTLRKDMGKEGRLMFEQRFTMNRFEECMCGVLRSCINNC